MCSIAVKLPWKHDDENKDAYLSNYNVIDQWRYCIKLSFISTLLYTS